MSPLTESWGRDVLRPDCFWLLRPRGQFSVAIIYDGGWMRTLALIVFAALFAVSGAAAFEIGGYRSGMTLEEVRSVSQSRGDRLIGPRDGAMDHHQAYELRNADGASSPIHFCDGKFATLSAVVPQGLKGFAILTADLVAAHGNPIVSTINAPADVQLDLHGITLSWTFGNYEWAHLQVSTVADGAPEVSYLVSDRRAWCGAVVRPAAAYRIGAVALWCAVPFGAG